MDKLYDDLPRGVGFGNFLAFRRVSFDSECRDEMVGAEYCGKQEEAAIVGGLLAASRSVKCLYQTYCG